MKRLFIITTCLLLAIFSFGQTKEIQYLSGTGSDQTVAWDFYCTGGRNSGTWTKIQVPSCWELQGFGTYNYGRDYKTYGRNFRFSDEKGLYKHQFEVPSEWKNKRVFLVFEGSMTDTKVKINGESAGPTHRGAFYRFKYDITDKLKFGKENLLEAEVSKMSSERTVNNAERLADYWVFGGIFRPVYLEAVNKEYIDYVAIDAKADGSFSMQAFPQHLETAKKLSAEITDLDGQRLSSVNKSVEPGDSVLTVSTKVEGIAPWTSETPNLYMVNVDLKNETGETIYRMQQRFGFRTIEIREGDGIYINGTQVKMKGVNRHSFWPETGRTLNDSIQLLDVRLIKEMNMNAVRCSHYPPDQRFLELCDSLGLYVLDELAGWQTAYGTEAGRPLVEEIVKRDLNHPSIIFWANGNEGGTNKALDADFSKWDFSKRPVIHPHHRPGNEFNGIDCDHYEDYYSSKHKLENNDSLIYMPTEFLHSQDDGGAAAGMYDFWELFWHSQRSGGGFIWAFIDEGVVRTDRNNIIDNNGLNANDGILGPHREKEGSFFALKEIFSPVRIEMKEIPATFNKEIEVENRYHFTDLNENSYQWALVNFSKPFDLGEKGYLIQKTGRADISSVKPKEKGFLTLDLPDNYRTYDALILKAVDRFGNEIYKWTWKLKTNEELLTNAWNHSEGSAFLQDSDSIVILKHDGLEIDINKNTGLLTGVRDKKTGIDNLLFRNGPVLTQGTSKVSGVEINKDQEQPSIKFVYEGEMKEVTWTMQKNGWLRLDYEYELQGSFPFAGVSFNYPENYILSAKWLGKGPYRQWKNRSQGTPLNVWENYYNDTHTSYWPVVYPEFKGYYGEVTWMEFNTVQGMFYMATKDTGINVRLFDFYGLSGIKPQPGLPKGDISFLDAIPPIGGKLALNVSMNTKRLGPHSELKRLNGPVKHTLYFYFGLPKQNDSNENYTRPVIDEVF